MIPSLLLTHTLVDFTQFDEPTVLDVLNYVCYNLSAKWQAIGFQLGLNENNLKIIMLNNASNPQAAQSSMREVIHTWYSAETSEFSWQNLANVLMSVAVNERKEVCLLHEKLSKSNKRE